jgi:hypothetical protein
VDEYGVENRRLGLEDDDGERDGSGGGNVDDDDGGTDVCDDVGVGGLSVRVVLAELA